MKPYPLASLNHLTVPVAIRPSFPRIRVGTVCCLRPPSLPLSRALHLAFGAHPPRMPAHAQLDGGIVRAKAPAVKRLLGGWSRPSAAPNVNVSDTAYSCV